MASEAWNDLNKRREDFRIFQFGERFYRFDDSQMILIDCVTNEPLVGNQVVHVMNAKSFSSMLEIGCEELLKAQNFTREELTACGLNDSQIEMIIGYPLVLKKPND